MVAPMALGLALLLVIVQHQSAALDVKIGLMMPQFDPSLRFKIGFGTSAAAVTIALDRVKREQLLPGVNFKIMWNFTECDESLAAGVGVELLKSEAVDVIIGPACSPEAVMLGVLGKYYNLPIFSWAAIGPELEDKVRFPTLARTIGSAKRMGRAVRELLMFFRWQRVAMIATDDHATRKCYFISRGVHEALLKSSIKVEYRMELDYGTPTDQDLNTFFDGLKTSARIVVVCLDLIEDRRKFMLQALDRGFATDDFVYVLPDYMPDENRTMPWMDYKGTRDGREEDAKRAFTKTFIVEFQQADAKKLDEFKRQIPAKMREWPFYYEPTSEELYGSTYSPFLADTTYLYALALNKTLKMGGSPRDGQLIFQNSREVQFEGWSGPCNIDSLADREPNFVLKGFDQQLTYADFAEAQMFKPDGQAINLKVPEWFVWELRKGKKPRDVPVCGFFGELCAMTDEDSMTGVIISVVGVIFVILSALGIGLGVYLKRKMNLATIRKGMWKVSFGDLIKLDQIDWKTRSVSSGSQLTLESLGSLGSLGSHPSRKFENGELAIYKGQLCWVRNHHHNISLNHSECQREFNIMWEMMHANVNRFIGLCIDSPIPLSVWKYNSKGSLKDILKNENVRLTWLFSYSLIKDLIEGMEYLHVSPINSHGRLKTSNCVVDSRWVLKITDFGLTKIRIYDKPAVEQFLWTAPELLRMGNPPPEGTQKADVYSFAIVCQEVLTRGVPYCGHDEDLTAEGVARSLAVICPPFRPIIKLPEGSDVNPSMLQLIRDCWNESPEFRPDFKTTKQRLKDMEKGKHVDLMDHVLSMVEKYAGNLESQIGERTKQLVEEKKRSDLLLYRMLPKTVADKLKSGQRIDPEGYDSATVFFSDIVGFTSLSSRCSPLQIVGLLNDLFAMFDEIIDEYDVYKVETIGDGYMCVSGLPHRNGNKHAGEIADMSLHFQRCVKEFIVPHLPGENVKLRIGLHTGNCVAGVVGLKLPRYCLFGDTVNTASRMESHGKAGCIHITEETNRFLTKVIGGYRTKQRGEVIVKGKGVLNTFWLLGKAGLKNIEDQTTDSKSPPPGEVNGSRIKLVE